MESLGLALTLAALVSGSHDTAQQANEFPYIVSLHRNSDTRNFLCAGSLIATTWVLTTAHCLTKIACKIRFIDTLSPQSYNYSQILQRFHHRNTRSFHPVLPSNRLTPKANNIGLAMVEEVPHKNFALLSGLDYFTILGREVTFFEFKLQTMLKARIYQSNKGRIIDVSLKRKPPQIGFGHRPKPPRPIKGQNTPGSEANESFTIENMRYRIGAGVVILCDDHDFPGPTICVAKKCFGSQSDTDMPSTLPDYGAPLMHDNRIVGVTTEVENSYSMYTPVSPYLDWIHEVMKGDN